MIILAINRSKRGVNDNNGGTKVESYANEKCKLNSKKGFMCWTTSNWFAKEKCEQKGKQHCKTFVMKRKSEISHCPENEQTAIYEGYMHPVGKKIHQTHSCPNRCHVGTPANEQSSRPVLERMRQ